MKALLIVTGTLYVFPDIIPANIVTSALLFLAVGLMIRFVWRAN